MYRQQHFLITGGSTGIGLAVAERCAAKGAHVTIAARDQAKLAQAKSRIEAARASSEQQIRTLALDVTDAPRVAETLQALVAEAGAPRLLFNCAGAARPDYFESISLAQFEDTIRLNLFGARNVIAALLPAMTQPGSQIINTASLLGLIGMFGYTDYCASKFALIGFSEALRAELKPKGIRVAVLCPPDTDTPGFALENLTKPRETAAISKNASLMTPEAVADYLLRNLFQDHFLIIPGLESKLSYHAKRLIPGVLERVMNHIVRQVQAKL